MRIAFAFRPPIHDGVVVVGRWADGRPGAGLAALDQGGRLGAVLTATGFKGGEGEVAVLAPPPPLAALLVVGLGTAGGQDPARLQPGRLRRIGGGVAAALGRLSAERVTVALDLDAAQAAEFAYGLRLRAYQPLAKYRTRPDADAPGMAVREVVVAAADPGAAEAAFARLDHVAQGVFLARDLTAEPGNALGPQEFADRAGLLSTFGVEVTVLDEGELARQGLGLLAAVGRGSARAPRLVAIEWRGAPAGQPPLVLVGKGITFDAGGISIKPAAHMEAMKGDMAGAAAVLGALRAIAGRRAPVNVCGVLAIAENMPSGGALRPGDVVRSYSGRTVEVVDTDAEGRLVLADALAWAADRFRPRAMVDAATLTGAVVRVLGRHHAGLYASDDALAARLTAAGEAEDERLWRLPLSEACDEDLKSEIADLRNCAWGRVPDNDDAARFLQRFVPEGLPWAHLDIAGVTEADEDGPLAPKGATGFGVRLFDRWVEETGAPPAT